MDLVFATNNQHKIKEVQHLLKNDFRLLGLKEINCKDELPETKNTLEENALQKANYVHEKYKVDCFADDTGLEIEALSGKPGVLSARYAGEEKSAQKNIEKVLFEMKDIKNRKAVFKTVILLITSNKSYLFEGKIEGYISQRIQGTNGFGYDPIFIPHPQLLSRERGEQGLRSFAEMSLEEKNKISHRAIAVNKLVEFLNKGV